MEHQHAHEAVLEAVRTFLRDNRIVGNFVTRILNHQGHFAPFEAVLTAQRSIGGWPLKLTRQQLATALTPPLGKEVAPFDSAIVRCVDR